MNAVSIWEVRGTLRIRHGQDKLFKIEIKSKMYK